jgi:hypothetical protein
MRVSNYSAKAPLNREVVFKERIAILAIDSIHGENVEFLTDFYQKSSLFVECNTTWAKLLEPFPCCSYAGSNILNKFREFRSNLIEEYLAETIA